MNLPDIKRIVYTEQEIAAKVRELGAAIAGDYRGKRPLFISMLKATVYFFADLTRAIDYPVEIDFMAIGVIPNTTSRTGVVRITKDLDTDINGRHVLMIEDIVNTGLTLGYVMQNLMSRNPESLKVCTLLNNPGPRLVHIPFAYCGFEVPDVPLAGYGMDRKDRYRNLPYIAEIEG